MTSLACSGPRSSNSLQETKPRQRVDHITCPKKTSVKLGKPIPPIDVYDCRESSHSLAITQLKSESLIMVRRRPFQPFEIGLIPFRQSNELILCVFLWKARCVEAITFDEEP